MNGVPHEGAKIEANSPVASATGQTDPDVHPSVGNRQSPGSEPSGNGKGVVQAAANLSTELSSDSPALDRYRVILAEAKDNHDSLRHTVNDLRKTIKQTYAVSKAMSF